MGATAFQKGLGAVCLISYLVGAIHGLHPGLANATVLPYLLRFNCAATGVPVRKLATAQELPCTAVEAGMAWLLALRQALGIPESLGAAGVLIDEADGVAAAAAVDPTARPIRCRLPSGISEVSSLSVCRAGPGRTVTTGGAPRAGRARQQCWPRRGI